MLHGKNVAAKSSNCTPERDQKYLHTCILMSVSNLMTQLYIRFMKFYFSCLNSSNPIIIYDASLSKSCLSKVGFNIRSVLSLLHVSDVNLNDSESALISKLRKICEANFSFGDDEEVATALAISELVDDRGGHIYFAHFFYQGDLNFFIYSLCVET